MSRKIESQSRRYKSARTVERPKSAEIPIAAAKLLGGAGWLARVGPATLRQWEKRGWVPSYQLSRELWQWFNGARDKIPPRDRYADRDGALVERLDLTARYYDAMGPADRWWAAMGTVMETALAQREEEAEDDPIAARVEEGARRRGTTTEARRLQRKRGT